MSGYEMHVFTSAGVLSRVYAFACINDARAVDQTKKRGDLRFRHVQIWRGETMVYDGVRVADDSGGTCPFSLPSK